MECALTSRLDITVAAFNKMIRPQLVWPTQWPWRPSHEVVYETLTDSQIKEVTSVSDHYATATCAYSLGMVKDTCNTFKWNIWYNVALRSFSSNGGERVFCEGRLLRQTQFSDWRCHKGQGRYCDRPLPLLHVGMAVRHVTVSQLWKRPRSGTRHQTYHDAGLVWTLTDRGSTDWIPAQKRYYLRPSRINFPSRTTETEQVYMYLKSGQPGPSRVAKVSQRFTQWNYGSQPGQCAYFTYCTCM